MNDQQKITGLINNQIEVLNDELYAAKNDYASYHLDETVEWRIRDTAKLKCKVIEAQMSILQKLGRDFSDMLTPSFANS